MGYRGDNGTKEDSEVYTSEQVEAVLNDLGIDIMGQTHNDFLCYCPYHGNADTPAFTVGRTSGVFFCFNGSCNESGTLVRLIKDLSDRNEYQALRLIAKNKGTPLSLSERVAKALERKKDFEIPVEALERMQKDFWEYQPAIDYMHSRKFTDDTLKKFGVGWSHKKQMVNVPVHDIQGVPVGVVGRSIIDKRFENSKGMLPSQHMMNMHRAKRQGDTVIIVEASFSVMRVDQIGYPNVVGTIGGYMNDIRYQMIGRNFNHIVIMTDDDDPRKHVYKGCRKCFREGHNTCIGHNPGLALGRQIARDMPDKKISWAVWDYKQRYPYGKDPDDLTDDEIVKCIKNSVSNFEFASWNLPEHVV